MGAVPQHGLVVQVVKAHPAAARRAKLSLQVADPGRVEAGADGYARVERVIAGDARAAVGLDTVAAIGVIRIGRFLRPVLRDAEPAHGAAPRAFRRTADERPRPKDVGAGGLVLAHKLV